MQHLNIIPFELKVPHMAVDSAHKRAYPVKPLYNRAILPSRTYFCISYIGMVP